MVSTPRTPSFHPLTLGNDSRIAKALVWAMVNTHPSWLRPDSVIGVPYAQIDASFKLTPGTTKAIWDMARNLAAVAATSGAFEAAFPPIAAAPGHGTWPGASCGHVVDFVQLLDPTADSATYPDVRTLPVV